MNRTISANLLIRSSSDSFTDAGDSKTTQMTLEVGYMKSDHLQGDSDA